MFALYAQEDPRESKPCPFNLKIEATARRRCSEARRRTEAVVVMVEGANRVLRDYALPQALSITSSIVSLAIEANNCKLNPAWSGTNEHPSDNAQCASLQIRYEVRHYQAESGVCRRYLTVILFLLTEGQSQ